MGAPRNNRNAAGPHRGGRRKSFADKTREVIKKKRMRAMLAKLQGKVWFPALGKYQVPRKYK